MWNGKSLSGIIAIGFLVCGIPASADSMTGFSDASALSGRGALTMMEGSVEAAVAVGTLVVTGIEKGAEGSVLVLAGVSEAGAVSLRVSGGMAGTVSVVVGDSVELAATASGHVFTKAGEIVAFIPNALGRSLLHHSGHTGGR